MKLFISNDCLLLKITDFTISYLNFSHISNLWLPPIGPLDEIAVEIALVC